MSLILANYILCCNCHYFVFVLFIAYQTKQFFPSFFSPQNFYERFIEEC